MSKSLGGVPLQAAIKHVLLQFLQLQLIYHVFWWFESSESDIWKMIQLLQINVLIQKCQLTHIIQVSLIFYT
jgi:hypothetical protein